MKPDYRHLDLPPSISAKDVQEFLVLLKRLVEAFEEQAKGKPK